jgi:hypothetical protein
VLIDRYDLEVVTPPCEPGGERFSAVARLVTDIGEVLPYLNATLRGAAYTAAAPALIWTRVGGGGQAGQSHLGAPRGDPAQV